MVGFLSDFKQWGSGPIEHSKTLVEGNRYKFTKDLPIAFRSPIFACVKDRGIGAISVSGNAKNTTVEAFAFVEDLYWDFIAIGF